MKTTNAKPAGRNKTVAAAKAPRVRKTSVSRPEPSEDQIRMKAQELYNERISSGVWGTAEDDWHRAEQILREI